MAKDTSVDLRNQVIYQVFPRQFSDTANFKGVTKEPQRRDFFICFFDDNLR